jgi:hypothetical protein
MTISEEPATMRAAGAADDTGTALPTASALVWRATQPGLWVATDGGGRPVGIVSERGNDGFVTTAVTGRGLGRHDTLLRAQSALEDYLATAEAATHIRPAHRMSRWLE